MPVSVQTPFKQYTADGTTGAFTYPFRIFKAADLVVSVDGVQITTGFSITGINDANGGNVVFTVGSYPVAGQLVSIERILEISRDTDYATTGDFRGNTVDNDFDKLVMIAQQQQAFADRSLKLPKGETTARELPTISERVNRLLAFDDSGNPAPGPTTIDINAVAAGIDSINSAVAAIDSIIAAPAAASTAAQKAAEALASAASAAASAAAAVSAAAGSPPILPIIINPSVVSVDTTIGLGNNALSIGPLTISPGITVSVQTGSTWTII